MSNKIRLQDRCRLARNCEFSGHIHSLLFFHKYHFSFQNLLYSHIWSFHLYLCISHFRRRDTLRFGIHSHPHRSHFHSFESRINIRKKQIQLYSRNSNCSDKFWKNCIHRYRRILRFRAWNRKCSGIRNCRKCWNKLSFREYFRKSRCPLFEARTRPCRRKMNRRRENPVCTGS